MNNQNSSRKLFLMRHGERVDYCFGQWVPKSYNTGIYHKIDLNMPDNLPQRSQAYTVWAEDSPLTKLGCFQAQLTGEGFKTAELQAHHVYCSPAFRCIQTCDAFLKGCNKRNEIKIRIEPGLFEWLSWYKKIPNWMTPEELVAAGFNIDLDYKPVIPIDKIGTVEETNNEFYARSTLVTNNILKSHSSGNVLFVGHSVTLEVCSRELVGQKPRNIWGIGQVIKSIPYCSFLQVEENDKGWEITGRPFPHLVNTSNSDFNYNLLMPH